MNKLILIGNGFDLAHGLPTSYNDFIDDFWSTLKTNYTEGLVKEIISVNEGYDSLFDFSVKTENFEDFWNNIKNYSSKRGFRIDERIYELRNSGRGAHIIFKFKNDFFKQINIKKSTQNWVDIENEYYRELKKIVKSPKLDISKSDDEFLLEKKQKVITLNNEFEAVKSLLENYLINKVEKTYNFDEIGDIKEWAKVSNILRPNFIQKGPYLKEVLERLSKEFSFSEDRNGIMGYENDAKTQQSTAPFFFKSFLLSFNYTACVFQHQFYINRKAGIELCSSNYIHGVLGEKANPVNFGFGDEIDKDYQEIENIGDNEYLKNFKSFQYLNTDKYDELLRYIDSEKFQVYILGHSCGLSDRVLLNTIFEHKNCRSIKVFYHEKEEGKDNYTDIVQNISRHFKDKVSMRNKIVNKTLCSPLPQTVRFKKKGE